MTIYHHETGSEDAPALILSSALGTTAEMWQPQLPDLSTRFRVITYDHRGHGRSSVPPGPYSLADLASDVLGLMDELTISAADFAGLSLGGMVGMWLGVYAPQRVMRLALLCTFAEIDSPELWTERAKTVRDSGTASMIDASIDRWFTTDFQQSNPQVVARYREVLAAVPDEGYAACCEAIRAMDVASHLNEIEAQTLVIAGTHDAGATPAVGRGLAQAIPNGRFEEVEAAHLANVEKPDAVSGLLIDHFA